MEHRPFKMSGLIWPYLTAFGTANSKLQAPNHKLYNSYSLEFGIWNFRTERSEVRPKTVPGGQFEWGARLLKGNGGVHKVGYTRMEIAWIVQRHKPALQ